MKNSTRNKVLIMLVAMIFTVIQPFFLIGTVNAASVSPSKIITLQNTQPISELGEIHENYVVAGHRDGKTVAFEAYLKFTLSSTSDYSNAKLRLRAFEGDGGGGPIQSLQVGIGQRDSWSATTPVLSFPTIVHGQTRQFSNPEYIFPDFSKDLLLPIGDLLTKQNIELDSSNEVTLILSSPNVTDEYFVYFDPAEVELIDVGSVPTNSAPTNLLLSSSSVAENQAVNTAVGTLSATDPDVGDTFTYSLVAGSGDTDNSSFMIVGNELRTNGTFDYETKNSFSVRIHVTDSGGLSFEKQFTITVTDVNEASIPTIVSLSPADDATNVPVDANLTLTFNDFVTRAAGNIYIYRTSDNSVVQTINVNSSDVTNSGLTITVNLPVNLKYDEAYHVQIDAGAFVNAAQQDFQGISYSTIWNFKTVAQSSNADKPTVTPAITDEDIQSTSGLVISPTNAGGTATTHYKISNIKNGKLYLNDGTTPIVDGSFITAAQGSAGLKFTPNANLFTTPTTTFGFDIQAASGTDGQSLSDAVLASITVNPVNDAPFLANPISHQTIIAGNSKSIDVSNTFSDVDGDTLMLTATSNTLNVASVQLDNSQRLTVQGLAVGTEVITVTASDGHGSFVSHTFTITVTNTNPVFPNPTITETVEAGKTVSGTVAATDADGHVLTYSLVTGPTSGILTVNPNGTWSYTNNSSFGGTDSFKIRVNDGYGGTADITVNITVTASSHTVSFDVDGGSAVASQTVASGGKVTLPTANPTKIGHTFGGWYTSNSFTTPFDFNSAITANTVVYAKWTAIPVTHTVSFNVDGGSVVADQTVVSGGKATLPTPAPTKVGYTFGGWYTSSALTTSFDFNSAITTDTIVYAKWTAIPVTHTVSFDVDGGSAVADQTVVSGGKATLPTPVPTKAGYTFGGWYTSSALTTSFDFNSAITTDTIVYAKWTAIPVTHTVSFDVDGGSAVADQTVVSGGKATLPTPAPTKAGYTFGGWYTSSALTTSFDFNSAITTDTVVYAKWTAIPVTHTVSFDVDDGSGVADQTVVSGGKATLPTPAPTKAGYTFGGWYTSSALTTSFDFNSAITTDTIVYAKWTVIPVLTHTVRFDEDGGSAVAAQMVVSGGKVVEPTPPPTKANYTFGGWYKEVSFATKWNFVTDVVTANTTLYARWISNVTPPKPLTDAEAVAKVKAALAIGYSTGDSATSVTQKLTLPVTGIEGTKVSWTSSNPAVVAVSGVVQRPSVGDSTVILTATIVKGSVTETKQFTVIVKGYNDSYPPVTSTPDSSSSDSTPVPPSNTQQIVVDVKNGSGGVVSKAIIKRTKNADGTFNDVVTLTEQSAREAVAKLKEQGLVTARIILPDQQDNVNEIYVSIPKSIVSILKNGGVNLEIVTNNVRILIPTRSLETFNDDLYFRVMPMKAQKEQSEVEERARKEAMALDGVDSTMINVLGRPLKIETNMQNRPVEITLPLPTDVTQEQLNHLAIFIEHSDGTKEIVSGKVVTLADGKLGIQFTIQKFSTFSVLYAPKKVVVEEVPVETLPTPIVDVQFPYIQGYTDGTFRPNAHITRTQMAAMLARNLSDNDVPASSKASYTDTTASWAKDEIEYVRAQGIMTGREDGKFGPNESVTRAQMAAIAMRWIDKQCVADDTATYCTAATTEIIFNDVDSQHWAASYIEEISALGIMTGVNSSTFNPEGSLTRAQAVKVLNRLFERELKTASKEQLFSDVPTDHWAFGEIQAAAIE